MKIVLLVGLPGSGKSSYAEQHGGALSSDEIRRLLCDDPTNQSIHRQTFAMLRHLLKVRLALKRPVTIVDATNLTPQERRPYIKIARHHKCEIEAVFFDVPMEECQRRNRLRNRMVPDEAIAAMAKKLVPPRPSEGFCRILKLP